MNKHLRLVLAAALLLFVPSLARQAHAANVDSSLKYVPADAFAVGGVHGDAVKRSQLYKKLLATLLTKKRDKAKLDELERETGFDPRKDIKAIVGVAPPEVAKNDDAFAIIAEARVNERRMLAFMKKEGNKNIQAKQSRLGKYYLLGKRKDGAIAFRGSHVIVAGSVVIEKVLAKQGASARIKRALSQVKRHHVFAVFAPTSDLKRDMGRDVPALGQVNLMRAGLDVAAGAKLNVVASFDTAKAAQQAEQIANEGLKQGAKDRKLKRMKLDGLVNQIKLRRQGRDLTGKLAISGQQMDGIIKMLSIFL